MELMPRLDWLMACSENDPDTETLLDSSVKAFSQPIIDVSSLWVTPVVSLLTWTPKCPGFIATNTEIKNLSI
jgi:hypothetical protein